MSKWTQPMTGVDVALECDEGDYYILINGIRLFGADPSVVPMCSVDCRYLGLIDDETGVWWFNTRDHLDDLDAAARRLEHLTSDDRWHHPSTPRAVRIAIDDIADTIARMREE